MTDTSTVNLEQVQETYSIEMNGKYYTLISIYNATQDTTDITIMCEGEPIEEGSKEYEEVLLTFNLAQEE